MKEKTIKIPIETFYMLTEYFLNSPTPERGRDLFTLISQELHYKRQLVNQSNVYGAMIKEKDPERKGALRTLYDSIHKLTKED